MPNKVAHFAIEAKDVDRAREFYQNVFQWIFEPWGPPGFYRIMKAGIQGALQQRDGPDDVGRKGFVCTIAVDDLGASMDLIEKNGGTITGAKFQIPTVGELCQFTDTEGNSVIVMQYEPSIAASMRWGDDE